MGQGRRRSVASAVVSTAALLSLTALLGACALATFNGEDYAITCSFAGRATTPCGQCIATNCQAPVNACCADATCKKDTSDSFLGSSYGDPGALKHLDTCASGGSCSGLEAHPSAQAITACIQTSCQASCDLWRRSSLRAEATNCKQTAGDSYSQPSCECTIPATTEGAPTTPNSVSCKRKTVPDGLCCASKDWPAPASTCRCKVVTCQPSGESCNCQADTYSSNREGVNACARGGCCIRSDGQCSCGSGYCSGDSVPVEQCTPSIVVCADGQRTVDSCSAK